MTLHILSLPHTPFSEQLAYTCAYTCKYVKLAKGLQDLGAEVVVYVAGDDHTGPAVEVMHKDARDALFGEWVPGCMPNVDWGDTKAWGFWNRKTIAALKERVEPGDFVFLPTGSPLYEVADWCKTAGIMAVEAGVGYEGALADIPHVWESYAWRHHIYGKYPYTRHDLDTVIGNSVDQDAFFTGEDRGYALFIGRVIRAKGVERALRWANECELPLIIVGPGAHVEDDGAVVTDDGMRLQGAVTHYGSADPAERAALLAHATVLMVPTHYVGPWEGVHAEALMSGVAPVGPDLGVFVETLPQELRFTTDADGVRATKEAIAARSPELRESAIQRFGLDAIARRYLEWCTSVS